MGITTGLAWTLLALRLEHQGFDGAAIGFNAAAQSFGIVVVGFVASCSDSRGSGWCAAAAWRSRGAIAVMLLLPLFDSYGAWLLLRFLLGASFVRSCSSPGKAGSC